MIPWSELLRLGAEVVHFVADLVETARDKGAEAAKAQARVAVDALTSARAKAHAETAAARAAIDAEVETLPARPASTP